MLSGVKKIAIEEKSVINGAEIAGFRAVFSDAEDITFIPYQNDKAACKEHRKELREDQAAFEDYAYNLQEEMFGEKEGDSEE